MLSVPESDQLRFAWTALNECVYPHFEGGQADFELWLAENQKRTKKLENH